MPTTESTLLRITTVVLFVRLLLLLEADDDPEEVGRVERPVEVPDIVIRVSVEPPLCADMVVVDIMSVTGDVTISVVEATEDCTTTVVVEGVDTGVADCSVVVDAGGGGGGGGGGGPTAVADATGAVAGTEARQPK